MFLTNKDQKTLGHKKITKIRSQTLLNSITELELEEVDDENDVDDSSCS